ncbi:hypothetical protein ES703_48101 [subsurface metagenome]
MWRSKKFAITVLLAAVVLVGSLGGVALAQEEGTDSQPEAIFGVLWDKVASILQREGVDVTPEQLKDAFSEAKSELRNEAMQNRLQNLVDQGRITQGQADEWQSWQEARPDLPAQFGFKGRIGFRGMHRMRGFGGQCAPTE